MPGVIEKSRVCLRKQTSPRSAFFLDLYRHYRNGILPIAGGLLDQPYSYVRAMSVIDLWMNRNE